MIGGTERISYKADWNSFFFFKIKEMRLAWMKISIGWCHYYIRVKDGTITSSLTHYESCMTTSHSRRKTRNPIIYTSFVSHTESERCCGNDNCQSISWPTGDQMSWVIQSSITYFGHFFFFLEVNNTYTHSRRNKKKVFFFPFLLPILCRRRAKFDQYQY